MTGVGIQAPSAVEGRGHESRQRLWVISELYHPERTSTGYFLTCIAEGVADEFNVGVICAQPTYAARGTRAARHEIRGGVEVFRCPSTTLSKDVLPFRLLNALTLAASTAFRALRSLRRGDVALVVTNPPILPLVIAAVCRVKGARLIVLVHDVYPDVLTVTGLLRRESFIVRALRYGYDIVFRQARHVVVLGRDMLSLLEDRVDAAKLAIIPNWGDVDSVQPLPRAQNRLLREHGIMDRFVAHYLGNMGRTHDLDVLLAAAVELEKEDIHFIFTGDGYKRPALQDAAEGSGVGNVTLLPGCPREQVEEHLNACDVAIISFRRGMSGVSVPSRLYNVLAAGKPILAVCDRTAETARVVVEHRCGWVVEPENLAGVVQVLRQARAAPELLAEMGARARSAAVEHYTLDRVIQKYDALVRPLLTAERLSSPMEMDA